MRPAILPKAMFDEGRIVKQSFPNGKMCYVVLSDEGMLALRVHRLTGIPFHAHEFAWAIVDADRKFEAR